MKKDPLIFIKHMEMEINKIQCSTLKIFENVEASKKSTLFVLKKAGNSIISMRSRSAGGTGDM